MRKQRTGWALLTPSLIILFLTGFLPFIYVIVVGFFSWNPVALNPKPQWFGVENFRLLVFDKEFLGALSRTSIFTLITVGAELIIGFILASLLLRDFRGKAFFRTIHALPLVIAPIVVGAIWKLLTIPGFGPLPYYLDKWFGIDYNIGRYAGQAFWTVVLMDIWHWTPFVTLVILAGLSAMPKDPVESAKVDGANDWQILRHITLPLLTPVLLTVIFLRFMDALRIVDEPWMLTGGGPGTATRFVGIHIWRVVFPQTSYGYGSAMSLLLLYFTVVACWLLYVTIMGRGEER